MNAYTEAAAVLDARLMAHGGEVCGLVGVTIDLTDADARPVFVHAEITRTAYTLRTPTGRVIARAEGASDFRECLAWLLFVMEALAQDDGIFSPGRGIPLLGAPRDVFDLVRDFVALSRQPGRSVRYQGEGRNADLIELMTKTKQYVVRPPAPGAPWFTDLCQDLRVEEAEISDLDLRLEMEIFRGTVGKGRQRYVGPVGWFLGEKANERDGCVYATIEDFSEVKGLGWNVYLGTEPGTYCNTFREGFATLAQALRALTRWMPGSFGTAVIPDVLGLRR